jgi:hypothetical protein
MKLSKEREMAKKLLISIFALLLSLSFTEVYAFTSYGARGCGTLISAIDTTDKKDEYSKDLTRMVVQGWIAGYVSAYNSWQEVVTKKKDTDVIGATDINGVWQSVLNYCRANPLQNVNDAMGDTIDKLDTQQKKKR